MTNDEKNLHEVQARLDEMGIRVLGMTIDETATYEQRVVGATNFFKAYLDGNYKRIFMFDRDDDSNGWLTALQEAWNIADKSKNDKLAEKLEEIIRFHMNDFQFIEDVI